MYRTILAGLFAGAALIAGMLPAMAQSTPFLTEKGTINFPFRTPAASGQPYRIDNTIIGGTTPRAITGTTITATTGFVGPISGGAVAATTLSASGAVTGAGFTALFASPPSIGSTAPGTGAFTTLSSTGLGTLASLKVDTGTKTATASGGAATLDKNAGVITSEALTTVAGASYTLTLTNSTIAAADQVLVSVANGTNSQGIPIVSTVIPGAGSVVIKVENNDLAAAFNGTIKVAFVVLKN